MDVYVQLVLVCAIAGTAYLAQQWRSSKKASLSDSESDAGKYGIEDLFASSIVSAAYGRTVANLRNATHPEIAFDGTALCFTNYPFEPAKVFPCGKIEADEVAEVCLGYPSQIRLKHGEVLFVPRNYLNALLEFVNNHDLPVVRRFSIWGSLLDPFLDTSTDQKSIDGQFAWFEKCGLTREEVDRWRREVGPAMIAYNFGTRLWEWGGFDLYDALTAQKACLERDAFLAFYQRALTLTGRDPLIPQSAYVYPVSVAKRQNMLASALHSVLLSWFPKESGGSRSSFRKRQDKWHDALSQFQARLEKDLLTAYAEPHRHYHGLTHVENCLQLLEKDYLYADHLNEITWALLFHDAIYDPQRHDNEALSADWACEVMAELGRPEADIARVRRMILATTHSCDPATTDEALMLDIDCAILGASAEVFEDYECAIRKEYAFVPEQMYRHARVAVLQAFIKRERIYWTSLFRQRCETSARENIAASIHRLSRPGAEQKTART